MKTDRNTLFAVIERPDPHCADDLVSMLIVVHVHAGVCSVLDDLYYAAVFLKKEIFFTPDFTSLSRNA